MSSERRPIVAYVGGIGDSEKALQERALPLREGYDVSCVSGRWFNRKESAPQKIERIQDRLIEVSQGGNEPIVIFAASAGGPLSIAASQELPFVKGIATAASPLRLPSPDETSRKQRAFMGLCPALYDVMSIYEKTLVALPSSNSNFLHFRGETDERVPPWMSSMDENIGARHVVIPSQRKSGFSSIHTATITTAVGSKELQEFIAAVL